MILNRVKDYYENEKKRLREQARDKYRNLSEKYKNKKREYGKNRYHNISEEKIQRLKEYQKNYLEAKKSQYSNQYILMDLIVYAIKSHTINTNHTL